MAQRSIGVSEQAWQRLQQVIQDLSLQGKHYSQSRTLDYLAHFERAIREEWGALIDMPAEQLRSGVLNLICKGLDYIPPALSRVPYKRSRRVDTSDRHEWLYVFVSRLDMPDPPKHIVDAAIDLGNIKHHMQEFRIRKTYLESLQLKKAGLSEDQVLYLKVARLEKEFYCGKGKDLTEEQLVAIQEAAKAKVSPEQRQAAVLTEEQQIQLDLEAKRMADQGPPEDRIEPTDVMPFPGSR